MTVNRRGGVRRRVLIVLLAVLGPAAIIALVISTVLAPDEGRPGRSAAAAGALTVPPVPEPGWRAVWVDGFDNPVLDPARWFRYHGQPRDGRGGWWLPSHAAAEQGVLVLRGERDLSRAGEFVTAGINSSVGSPSTYGRFLVRLRVDRAKRVEFATLLVGPEGKAGPYVVIAADDVGDRRVLRAGLFTTSTSGAPLVEQRTTRVDTGVWRTVGVDWSPGLLIFTLDGREWGSVRSPLVPSTPMVVALQTQATCAVGGCDPPLPQRADLEADWVSVQARTAP